MECFWRGERLFHDLSLSGLPEELLERLRHGSNAQYMDTLALLALDNKWTSSIYSSYKPLFVDICNRWLSDSTGRFRPLHVVLALSRILPLARHLSVYVEELVYRQHVDEFEVLASKRAMGLLELSDGKVMDILIIINRLLEFDNHTFAMIVSPAQLQVLFGHPKSCVRYLAIRALCSYLHAGDATFLEMVRKYIEPQTVEGPWEGQSIDYTFYHLWEEKHHQDLQTMLLASKEPRSCAQQQTTAKRVVLDEDILPLTISFGGVLMPNMNGSDLDSSFVYTKTTTQNLQRTAEAIVESRAVLVTGTLGSGKSSAILHIAKRLNKTSNMLTLHLNEQTDAKMLIGMYTSATAAGSFRWQPGVLTTAVKEGRWVLIEDLDRAPVEVVSILLPLLDRGELFVPNLGGPIRTAPGFKLIATIRSHTNGNGEDVIPGVGMLGFRHWTRVQLQTLSDQDLGDIIATRFPILHLYQPQILSLYRVLKSTNHNSFKGSQTSQLLGKPQGPQDLIRFCKRVHALLANIGVRQGTEPISQAMVDNIFMEAVDCFASVVQSESFKASIILQIAQELHVAPARAEFCTQSRTPEYLDCNTTLMIGRATVQKCPREGAVQSSRENKGRRPFAATDQTLRQLESIAVAVSMSEPCLLVGETGTGKTTIVQELAAMSGHNLVVVNLSQQSEAGDLLGGYKPVNLRTIAMPMQEEFEELFDNTFQIHKNERYFKSLARTVAKGQWVRTLTLWREALNMLVTVFPPTVRENSEQRTGKPKKRRKLESTTILKLQPRWDNFASQVETFQKHVDSGSKGFSFAFMEGNIVKAVRRGDWVLLDEINLASPDTLESLADLLSDNTDTAPSILLSETGDIEKVRAHPGFRIFGAMNPATDVGKRDLPMSLRSRFTEYYIEAQDKNLESLKQIVNAYLGSYVHGDVQVTTDIAQLYLNIKQMSESNRLADGADQKPHYSLRTLTRTLLYVSDIAPLYGLRRALFEGFSMTFLTVLNKESELLVLPLINKFILGSQRNVKALLRQIPRIPEDNNRYVQFRHYWVGQGPRPIEEQSHYIITPFIEANLLNLVRATSSRRFPVLLQGPTSSGKTSMLEYLAKLSGNTFVRINNHEHTDLQEYMGTYISDAEGHLQFQEGILVRALREGHWIVLDELNLAPTDVLEALNRLLDDNRELFIPETQDVVRPHKNFMLFATQNPPGLYGGRKVLSRAFRNRFLELHFDEIPEDELETILRERTQIAPSYCTNIVTVYKRLALFRQSGRLFEQKNSFATLRDLFRWALRKADDREQLANNGFMLLGERVRNPEERVMVKHVIEDVMRVKIDETRLYSLDELVLSHTIDAELQLDGLDIVWTSSMRRLFVLIAQALINNEPVLLVGPTGCGKTSACQALAKSMRAQMYILNAHQNTETGDIIGAQRPIRNRSTIEAEYLQDLAKIFEDESGNLLRAPLNTENAWEAYNAISQDLKDRIPVNIRHRLEQSMLRARQLFEWSDGILVTAMKTGNHFLLDEISLADDSVLERLNSVLEPDRTLLLAEKGPFEALVQASNGFQFLATMNPGGDYGKKELSPALRNRFTEIWVPQASSPDDILEIAEAKLNTLLTHFAKPMVEFATWYSARYNDDMSSASIRQMLTWIDFVNKHGSHDPVFSILHGAAMVFIDGLGANPSAKLSMVPLSLSTERHACLAMMSKFFNSDMRSLYNEKPILSYTDESLNIGRFSLKRLQVTSTSTGFNLEAPTTFTNILRVARALQIRKPILIEGAPGVGKTSLITVLANALGIPLTRINLSEQTDIMDLFGSDVPVEGANLGKFTWRDAPFLRAMKRGEWVLLDEMNLASQSVLEGLNACLDHRGEIYVPELDQRFFRHPQFVLFAAQNPHRQGGGRKGLPASFINRFTVVYADTLISADMLAICDKLYPDVPRHETETMVKYVDSLATLTQSSRGTGFNGGPWEFNLRDTLRWLYLLHKQVESTLVGKAIDYQNLLFLLRFRNSGDTIGISKALSLPADFSTSIYSRFHNLSALSYQCGLGVLERRGKYQYDLLNYGDHNLEIIESILLCVQHSWPCMLVGPAGSGKSSAIHYVGSVVGAEIVEFPLNADMDTMDLIGGYEQIDAQRLVTEFALDLGTLIRQSLVDNMLTSADFMKLSALLEMLEPLVPDLQRVLELLQETDVSDNDLRYTKMVSHCRLLMQRSSFNNSTQFEWVDGILIRALEQGHWLVLDNANLCSSSVLDRLNALLEPEGVLAVHEYRSPDGSSRTVRPHKEFRLFLTMDPRHGELSRAMRNRCIELFLSSDSSCFDNPFDNTLKIHAGDSLTFRFRTSDRFDWNACDNTLVCALASVCIDHLAFQDFDFVESWWSQVIKGLIDISPSKSQLFAQVLRTYGGLVQQQGNILAGILQLYQNQSAKQPHMEDFCRAQTIHPLNNTPLLPLEKRTPCTEPTYLAGLLETLVDLEGLKNELMSLSVSVQYKPASQLSRLERSMLSSSVLAFSKDSIQPLASFLGESISFLLEWINHAALNRSDMEVIIALAKQFKNYIRDIFESTAVSTFDEGIFQSYLEIGKSLVSSLAGFPLTLTLCSNLQSQLDRFKSSWELSTGTSMGLLWSRFKPPTARNNSELAFVLRVENLLDRLDGVAWRSNTSFERLVDLRRSISHWSFAELSASQVAEDTFTLVEGAVDELEETLAAESIHPYFQQEFEGMYQIYVHAEKGLLSSRVQMLGFLAGHDSRRAIRFGENTRGSALLEQIQNLTGITHANTSLMVLRNLLPISILSKLSTISDAPLKSLALLGREVELLAEYTTCASQHMSQDPTDVLNHYLSQLHREFHEAHIAQPDDGSTKAYKYHENDAIRSQEMQDSLNNCISKSRIQSGSATQLLSVVNKYMQPSLNNLGNASHKPYAIIATTKAWINFFTGCLLLYVPDRPFDPALKPIVERERYEKRTKELRIKLQALQLYEKTCVNQSTGLRCHLVQQELQILGDQPPVPAVVRPIPSELPHLQGEFTNLLNAVIKKCPDAEGIESALAGDEIAAQEIQLLRQNLAQSIDRLLKGFRTYDDITRPIVGLLSGLDVGLLLLQIATDLPKSVQGTDISLNYTPLLGFGPKSCNELSTLSDSEALQPRMREQLLALGAIERGINGYLSSASIVRLHRIFQAFYLEWKQNLARDQERESTQTSLYRYRGGQDENESASDVELEEIFPSYGKAVQEKGENCRTDKASPQAIALKLAAVHRYIFTERVVPTSGIFQMIKDTTADLASQWKETERLSIYPNAPKYTLVAVTLALSSASQGLRSHESSDGLYNFYVHPNLPEVHKLVLFIGRIKDRYRTLQSRWPEHATLEDVLRVSDEIRAFRHVDPLAKIITKCEQLHTFMHEWEILASKEYSAIGLYNELTSLLVDWRRLELSTWARLLDMEDRKCVEAAKSWWFVAYEAIIAASISTADTQNDLSLHTEQLITTLNDFLYQTSVGQFSERLCLIESFKDQLGALIKDWPSLRKLGDALVNFLRFHTRFEAAVHEVHRTGRKKLEKTMKEVIQLASWKDTNILALRESAKRSHHKLFKVIRKYRAWNDQPVERIIKQGIQAPLILSYLPAEKREHPIFTVDAQAIEVCRRNLREWKSRPSRYNDPEKVVLLMDRVQKASPSALDCINYVDSFCDDFKETVKTLQSETPSVLCPANMATVKHLKSRKRKFFADTLREIRRMGFVSHPGTDILQKQASLPIVLAASSALQSKALSSWIAHAEQYFYMTIENMDAIRESAKQHSAELSSGEVARSVGYLESMVSTMLKQREVLATSLVDLETLEVLLDRFKGLWSPEHYTTHLQARKEQNSIWQSVELCIKWLPSIIDVGTTVIQQHNQLAKRDCEEVVNGLTQWKSSIQDLVKDLTSIPKLPSGLSSSLHTLFLNNSKMALENLGADLMKWQVEQPTIGYVLDQILLWCYPSPVAINQDMNGIHTPSIEEIDHSLSTVIDTILVAVQGMQEALATLPTSSETTTWLLCMDGLRAKILGTLHIHQISKQLEHVMFAVQYVHQESPQTLICLSALSAVALPIIHKYSAIFKETLLQYLGMHTSMCRMSCTLTRSFATIVTQGFCNPAEKGAGEASKTEKLESGMGLGEGEGAEDISKDVQDDEDLSELAQENTNKNEGEIEDVEDAVNMNDDELQGELGEPADDHDDDETDAESEESKKDVEEQIGDIDDLDPSAVDEKLWEGSADDEKKDKEGNQAKGQKKDELTAQENSKDADENHAGEEEEIEDTAAEEKEAVGRENNEKADPHLKDEQTLDLPDEMSLDSDDDPENAQDNDEMDKLSDVDQEESIEIGDNDEKSIDEAMDRNGDQAEELQVDPDDQQDEPDKASSPMDTDPGADEDDDEQHLLERYTEEAMTDAKNEFPSEGQGIDQHAEPQDDVSNQNKEGTNGTSGELGNATQEEDEQAKASDGESNHKTASTSQHNNIPDAAEVEAQAFKKLGDALEKWHRQSEEIKNATAEEMPSPSNAKGNYEAAQDFEHLPNNDVEADTQALGAATEDEAQALDSRAMGVDAKEDSQDFLPDANTSENIKDNADKMEDRAQSTNSMEHQDPKARPGAMVGVNTDLRDTATGQRDFAEDNAQHIIEELDNDLSTIHLAGEDRRSAEEAGQLWVHYESSTRELALSLTEQLRLILSPTLATKMRGDFRTGKRLNIKRIIPYIASQYKRDKIWMRRSIPAKRNYQILLAVDDSKSMGENGSGQLAFETLALISKSLSMLEVGQICIVAFGEYVRVAHQFDQTFSSEAGARVLQQFGFQQTKTNVRRLIADSIELFREARSRSLGAGTDLWQLELIISDGVCEDHEDIHRLVRQAQEERIMIVFVIVDSLKGKSIVDMTQATFEEDGGETKLKIKRYLEGFPFRYYLIVGNVMELPAVLAVALRQWFAEVTESA